MTVDEFKDIVCEVSGLPLNEILSSKQPLPKRYKYALIIMVWEEIDESEGECTHDTLAHALNMVRCTITQTLKRIDGMLEFDREFKKIYKACEERRVEMEEQNEI